MRGPGRTNSTSRLIEGLFGDGSAAGMTDEQLLARFTARRDPAAEQAFEILVQRHGPMVLAVCRSSVHDLHDAEDAFQATFLVLARKAAKLNEPALRWALGLTQWPVTRRRRADGAVADREAHTKRSRRGRARRRSGGG